MAIVLIYGPDRGLVAERARLFVSKSGIASDDPFSLVRIDASDIERDPGRLIDEAGTVSMFSARRLIWVRDAGAHKGFADAVKALASSPLADATVLIEAGELKKGAALRTAVEAAAFAIALPCYSDDGRSIDAVIDDAMQKAGVSIGLEARQALKRNLGGDRLASRSEIEKLLLYAQGIDDDRAGRRAGRDRRRLEHDRGCGHRCGHPRQDRRARRRLFALRLVGQSAVSASQRRAAAVSFPRRHARRHGQYRPQRRGGGDLGAAAGVLTRAKLRSRPRWHGGRGRRSRKPSSDCRRRFSRAGRGPSWPNRSSARRCWGWRSRACGWREHSCYARRRIASKSKVGPEISRQIDGVRQLFSRRQSSSSCSSVR